jgi:hypothetical protein
MTNQQDYLDSIIASLARIKLSEPGEETLECLDKFLEMIGNKLDPAGLWNIEDTDWAHLILQAESRAEALDCFTYAECGRLARSKPL